MLRESESLRLAASARWQAILGRSATVGLAEVAETAVAHRRDTKFVLHHEQLCAVLGRLGGGYRVLDIDGSRFTAYRTRYFDTESFALFRRHHAGGSNRCKIRLRHYANTGVCCLEVKRKVGSGATIKHRLSVPDFELESLRDYGDYIAAHCPYPAADLRPSLVSRFDRICLIDPARAERLTIDLDLEVEAADGAVPLPNIAVAELKQERQDDLARESEFLRAMRAIGVRPTGFSKYCIGLLLTHPGIKHNLFKPQLRQLRQLMGETHAVA